MFTGILYPFPPLVSPRSFFLREFFSRALLSDRLEQATRHFNPFSIITSAFMLIWKLSPLSLVYTGEYRRLFYREIPVEGAFCDQIFAYLPWFATPAFLLKNGNIWMQS